MAFYPRHKLVPNATPALLTGTSSEFLGRRAWPKVLRERLLVVIIGPPGSGKSSVARKLAPNALVLDNRETQDRLVEYIGRCRWAPELLDAPSLILDGPVWLRRRPSAVAAFAALFRHRIAAGLHTVVVQSDSDASIHEVLAHVEPGEAAIVALRFPKGARGKLRFARRMCDELRLPRKAASGTEDLEPWAYEEVLGKISRTSGE